ncbi:MAG TPA: hypothetical protein V6D27_00785 [Vampirovibrionales bacterium]
MVAIPSFNFLITAKNLAGGAFDDLLKSAAAIKNKVGEAGAVAQNSAQGMAKEFFKAQIAVDAWRFALKKTDEAVNFVKKGFGEATNIQNAAIVAATTFSALTGASYGEAGAAIEALNNRLAKSAATLPGSTQDYKELATSINDNLVEAFKDAKGKLDVQAWEDATASIAESFGAITATSTKMTGNTTLGLTKALGGASVDELRSIALFEQNPMLLNEITDRLKEKNVKTLRDLSIADRVGLIKEVGEKFISTDFKNAAGESVDGLIQSYKSALFDPSSGIFGLMRDLEDSTAGTQSVFAAYNETIKLLIGSNSLWTNFSEMLQKLGLAADPMRILKAGFDFFNSALTVVVNIVRGINKTITPIKDGAAAIEKTIGAMALAPQNIVSSLKALDMDRILNIVTSNISRFIQPWVWKVLDVKPNVAAMGDGYKLDYKGFLKTAAIALIQKTGDWLMGFGQNLGSAVTDVLSVAAEVFYSTADLVIKKAPDIGEFVGNIAGTVVVVLGNLMSGFSEWISAQLPRFLATIRKSILAIGEFFQRMDFGEAVVRFVKSILPAINNSLQSLASTGIPGMVNIFSSALAVAGDVLIDVGKAIVAGLWTIATGIDWGKLLQAIGEGLVKIDWKTLIVSAGKAYAILLALNVAKEAVNAVTGLLKEYTDKLKDAVAEKVAGAAVDSVTARILSPIAIATGNYTAGLYSALAGGLAPITAAATAYIAGLSSAIAGGLASATTAVVAAGGLLIAPAALLIGAAAVLAGAFLILSGGDVENFKYAAEGWKAEMQALTGVEINGVGDAMAAVIFGLKESFITIGATAGSYLTLARSQINISLQQAVMSVSSFGKAIAELPLKAFGAAKATSGAISGIPGKAALAANTLKENVGSGIKQTKTDLEGMSGVEINSVGNAVGVVVYQYAQILPELVGTVFGTVGSGVNLVAAQAKLSVAEFFTGSAWQGWVAGWVQIGHFVAEAPSRTLAIISAKWNQWLIGWQVLGEYIAEAPGAALAGIQGWWNSWLDGWGILGSYAVGTVETAYSKAIAWGESWKLGVVTLFEILVNLPESISSEVQKWGTLWLSRFQSFGSDVALGASTLQSWWKGAWEKVWGILDPLAKLLGNDVANLRQTWSLISAALDGIPQTIKELIEKTKDAIKGFIPNTIVGVGNAVAAAAAPVTAPIQKASEAVTETAAGAVAGAGDILDSIGGFLGGVFGADKKEEAADKIPAMFVGNIPNFAGGMLGLIPSLLKAATTERTQMPPGSGLAIANTSEYILRPDQMDGLLSGLIAQVSSMVRGKIEEVKKSLGKIPGLGGLSDLMPDLGGLISKIPGLGGLSDLMPDLGGLIGKIPGLGGLMDGSLPNLSDLIPDLGGFTGQTPNSAITPPAAFSPSPFAPITAPFASILEPMQSDPIPSSGPVMGESKNISLGPITINISNSAGQDAEQLAREVLRYIDVFLQEEMGATL